MQIKLNTESVSNVIVAIANILAFGTEHEDDEENVEAWLELMRKLRAGLTCNFTHDLGEDVDFDLNEEERDTIGGALSYATGFYDVFKYPEKSSVIAACKAVNMEDEEIERAEKYFGALRKKLVALHGEEYVKKMEPA